MLTMTQHGAMTLNTDLGSTGVLATDVRDACLVGNGLWPCTMHRQAMQDSLPLLLKLMLLLYLLAGNLATMRWYPSVLGHVLQYMTCV